MTDFELAILCLLRSYPDSIGFKVLCLEYQKEFNESTMFLFHAGYLTANNEVTRMGELFIQNAIADHN